MVYSLANYIMSISIPDELRAKLEMNDKSISVGGEGSYLDNITVNVSENTYETEGDATGSWIHNKNLNKTGTIELNINQVSDKVARFKKIFNIYYSSQDEYPGLNITITDIEGQSIAYAIDCYIQKIPSQVFTNTAQIQTWTFTCGRITYD